ncbi:MAG: homoserine O-succinyltransferase [Terricaulis sp.]
MTFNTLEAPVAAVLKPLARTEDGVDQIIQPSSPFVLESGEILDDARINIRLHGRREAPMVIVLGGISATRRLNGPDGWWNGIVGLGAAVDTARFCAMGLDFAPNGDQRVHIAPIDQVRLIELALDKLGVARAHAFIGASYGGMVGLAFAQRAPKRLGRLCVVSAAHEPSPLGSAWRGVQRRIVEFSLEQGATECGLSLARQLAMITYRSAEEFQGRFDRRLDGHTSDLDRYLTARGEAFCTAMPPKRWLSLSESIDRTHVDPAAVSTPTTLVACSSDQLAPLAQMEDLSRRLPRLAAFHVLTSICGHDAFLKEHAQITRALRRFLDGVVP